jgi:dihydroxyacetone kinase-like protein
MVFMAEVKQIVQILQSVAAVIEKNKQYLTDLDAAIGDGDHGTNMSRGFTFVKKVLEDSSIQLPADLFKKSAMALIAHVGGASGPLFGTAFLRAAGALKDKTELGSHDYVAILKAAAGGVQMRGKAQKGDKTILDALLPACEAAEAADKAGKSAQEVLNAAKDAAAQGAAATEQLIAKKGRASYVGKRNIGHRDPGAESTALMLAAVADSCAAMAEA